MNSSVIPDGGNGMIFMMELKSFFQDNYSKTLLVLNIQSQHYQISHIYESIALLEIFL